MKPSVRGLARDWLGQPRGLYVLFLTEMWEVFSFFGMKTLLVYYMTKQLLLTPGRASLIYGAYSGFAYFTPIVGGLVSDRWLGKRNSVIMGGSVMALGHFMLMFPTLFYPALATVAAGAGLYLPSLPSQIGLLFSERDPRRGSAYNIYYVGMNLGAVLAPLVCGSLGEALGWHWGFGAAGVGMLAGVVIYVLGSRYLPRQETSPGEVNAPTAPAPADIRSRFQLIVSIALVVALFRGAYDQIGNSLALWLDAGVDRRLGDWAIPMTWFQSLNPLLVFGLTPLVLLGWRRQAAQAQEPSALAKMATGAVLLALGYGLLVVAASAQGRPSWAWFALFVVLLTAGELYLLPTCLGLFARLAPPRLAATGTAIWFMTGFGGNLLAGLLGASWSRLSSPVYFSLMAAVAGAAALLFILLDAPVRAAEARFGMDKRSDPPMAATP